MHLIFSLTVSESKRLIAKGIAAYPPVRRALDQGIVAVATGTTNGYVIEEISGVPFEKQRYVTGRTLPAGYSGARPSYEVPDFVVSRGERLSVSAKEIIRDMGPGDVFIKGANALNYERKQVGVLIGDRTGGTVGAVLGTIVARRIHLLQPVGLEKSVPGDLHAAALRLREIGGKGPTLWVTPGTPFTEIEALQVLAGVEAAAVGAGGIGGAEGAVWLAVFGNREELDRAGEILESVRGEPPFLGASENE